MVLLILRVATGCCVRQMKLAASERGSSRIVTIKLIDV
jgi:hypothetical protein